MRAAADERLVVVGLEVARGDWTKPQTAPSILSVSSGKGHGWLCEKGIGLRSGGSLPSHLEDSDKGPRKCAMSGPR
jgi:hypothetical protein